MNREENSQIKSKKKIQLEKQNKALNRQIRIRLTNKVQIRQIRNDNTTTGLKHNEKNHHKNKTTINFKTKFFKIKNTVYQIR